MARIVWRDGSVSSNLNNQEEKQDSGKPPSFFCALQAYGEVETLQMEALDHDIKGVKENYITIHLDLAGICRHKTLESNYMCRISRHRHRFLHWDYTLKKTNVMQCVSITGPGHKNNQPTNQNATHALVSLHFLPAKFSLRSEWLKCKSVFTMEKKFSKILNQYLPRVRFTVIDSYKEKIQRQCRILIG